MGEIKSYRDLEAWQVGMEVVDGTYDVTARFPQWELYGLRAQMQRAAVSVPSNIAEGQARGGRADLNHVNIAIGSVAELDTQLEIAIRRKYVARESVVGLQTVMESSRKLLYGMRRSKLLALGLSVVGTAVVVVLAFRLLA